MDVDIWCLFVDYYLSLRLFFLSFVSWYDLCSIESKTCFNVDHRLLNRQQRWSCENSVFICIFIRLTTRFIVNYFSLKTTLKPKQIKVKNRKWSRLEKKHFSTKIWVVVYQVHHHPRRRLQRQHIEILLLDRQQICLIHALTRIIQAIVVIQRKIVIVRVLADFVRVIIIEIFRIWYL